MFNHKVAFFAALIFIFTPVSWTLSETGLTNMPGQFALITLIFLLFKYSRHPKIVPFISFGFGLMLGLRFTELPIIISLLGLVIFQIKKFKTFVYTTAMFVAGFLVWFIPLILITGAGDFFKTYAELAKYILWHDSLLGRGSLGISTFRIKLEDLWYLLKIGYGTQLVVVSVAALLITLLSKTSRNFNHVFLFFWLISYLLPLIFLFNLEVTRYTLPLLPPIAILTSAFFINLLKNRFIGILVLLLLLAGLFFQSLDQVTRMKNKIPPTISPILYVRSNYKPENTIVISTLTHRHFEFYAPEFKLFRPEDISSEILTGNKTIVIDHFTVLDKIKQNKSFKTLEQKSFTGDKDINNRVNNISLYLLN